MQKFSPVILFMITLIAILFTANAKANDQTDPLPSWNESSTKKNIIDFVKQVTDKTNSHYVPPMDRIATFDNDGTLWVEQPIYTQFIFAIDRLKAMSAQHPEWKTQKPYSLILSGDKKALAALNVQDMERIMAVTHAGMSVEVFNKLAQDWLQKAKSPRYDRLYTQLIYQPMLEVMNYLRQNDFNIYIVTGGGQDFVRAFSDKTYHILPRQVIGTAGKTKYTYQNKQPVLIKLPEVLLVDDKAGKPEAINLFIGQKPIIAFGNSDGDKEMLEWTQSNARPHLMLLVHHDDAAREYAYGPESKVGTFSDALMNEANNQHWQVISMMHDWKTIFPAVIK
ncbi:MAG: HAD family hydrolase [Gammaproteobacteria bacterium]|nr:HAD family hydrolase [Gammaproteobacteria bacterium]